jgi:hypothetical protein
MVQMLSRMLRPTHPALQTELDMAKYLKIQLARKMHFGSVAVGGMTYYYRKS